ncbi:hypothetical protein [Cellulomonas soli]
MTSPGWAIRPAISAARSRVAQSTRKNPASCSSTWVYGPGAATGPPSAQRYTVDAPGAASASAVTSSPDSPISAMSVSNAAPRSACSAALMARPSAVRSPVG